MVGSTALLLLSALLLLATHSHCQCQGNFIVHPQDRTLDVMDTNVSLNCVFMHPNVTQRFFLWQIYLANGTSASINRARGNYRIDPTNGGLIITTVKNSHQGVYACYARPEGCTEPILSDNATITIKGPPTITLNNASNSYYIDNGMELNFNGTVLGTPESTLTIYRVVNGVQQSVDPSRFHLMYIEGEIPFEISVSNPARADEGTYRLVAVNSCGSDTLNLSIFVMGPDVPAVTLDPEKVSNFDSAVMVTCSVPPTADSDGSLMMVWKDPMNEMVPTTQSAAVYVIVMEHSVTLSISSFQQSHVGVYTCDATNSNSNDNGVITIYGPPRQVAMPLISNSTVSWSAPISDAEIIGYMLYVFRDGTDEVAAQERISDAATTMYPIDSLDLPPGRYGLGVAAIAVQDVVGETSDLAIFEVLATEPPPTDTTFPVAIVVGVVGGVLLLIALGAGCGIFFLCYWYPHKRRITSQHQTWSKEDLEAAPVNNYTTLTLHQPPDLPPSPSSPMLSSLFSADIDPKWEFPRENIQLSEELYGGQYTILYKGAARGIKELKPIEVMVKTVRDDATEDDVKTLVCEMELLASLGPHPNIVSLLRVCTVGKPLYMVMEYMCHGDLLGFLRASRGHYGMYTISPGIRNQPPCLHLSSRDLLSIAAKISSGMTFLADRKIAHRALCARNILVGTGMDIRIYNVGAFDMTFENRDALMKWMSPETLFDATATTYSDVWSFGVLLWELVTVGGTPYAEILPADLYTQLYSGMRMPKPHHCAQEVYDIMRLCWERNPSDRPYFAVIQERLEALEDSKLSFLDLRNYNEYDYSQFEEPPQLSTAL